MRVTVVAVVTRRGSQPDSRVTAQIPTFTLDEVTSFEHACKVADLVLDPHRDALYVSAGLVDPDGNYHSYSRGV